MMAETAKATLKQRPTIQDVAAAVGVSTGTVSRVLNDRPGVRARTRAQVLSAVEHLGYRPDTAARELSLRQATRIGFNIPSSSGLLSPFYGLFLKHLREGFQADGLRLEEIPVRTDGLPAHLADGMVLFGLHDDDPRIPYLHAQGVPTVLIGHAQGERWTRSDDYGGGREAARHLLRLGHTGIAHVSGDLSGQAAFDRYHGYRDALREAGIEPESELLISGNFETLTAYRALRRAVEGGLRFSAVFAASDEMAVGVLAALEDLGLRVPVDVSVVGFDDLPNVGRHLTTVRQDIGRIAEVAVTLLKEALAGEPVRHEIIPVRLIARGTTAKRR